MPDEDESVVRAAYEAYGRGEMNRMERGRIVALRKFRERDEAHSFAGLGQQTR
jgi:hypothetical protein